MVDKKTVFPWKCPRCGASPDHHGKGDEETCLGSRISSACQGLICECEDEGTEEHGTTFDDPCPEANCYHCGWGGTMPKKPKGLQSWEKKALELGWIMPATRREELGL